MPAAESQPPDSTASRTKVKQENRFKNSAKSRRVLQNRRDNGSDENGREDNEDDNASADDIENGNVSARKDKGKGRARLDDDMSEDDDEEQHVRNRKRVKDLNGHARRPSEVVGSDEEVQEDIDYDMLANKVFERDSKDGYVPGSIVRIACEHFLTYDFVQFSPGPRMNMILGPNGTGKSTIACAICIGLGFPIATLGRATKLTAFVKHGYETGWVEIELKGAQGKRNTIIRRNINTKNNSSTWVLNGKSSQENQVQKAVAESGVQITNLCSFLPQDRVNEFARLKPDQLLVETQKVAGHSNLSNWHEQLIEHGKEFKEVKDLLTQEKEECETEKGKNSILERDVAAFHKRKQLEEELQLHELLIPWYQFKSEKRRLKDLKLQWKEAGLKLANAMAEHQPAIDFKERLETEVGKAGREVTKAENEIKKLDREVKTLRRQDDDYAQTCEEIQNRIVDLRKDEDLRLKKIRELRERIKTTKAKLEDPENQPEDSAELERRVGEITRMGQQKHRQRAVVQRELDEKTQQIETLDSDVAAANEELRRMSDVKNARYRQMRNVNDPRTRHISDEGFMKVFDWLGENRRHFQSAVEPACFSVNVTDPEIAYAIEAVIPVAAGKTFIFSNEKDYQFFNKKINDEKVCGVVHVAVWYRPDTDHGGTLSRRDHSTEALKAAGFDGYAIDFIQAPESIKWFLCKAHDLHRIPIAKDARSVNPEQAQQMFAPQGVGQARYITGMQMNAISRSAYGKRLVQNSTSNILKPVWYTAQPIDRDKQQRCRETISLSEEKKRELEAELHELQQRDAAIVSEQTELNKEINWLRAMKEAITRKVAKLKQWKTGLRGDQELLTAEENKESLEKRETKLRENLVFKVKERLKAMPSYKRAIQALQERTTELTHATFKLIQAHADVAAMEKIVKSCMAKNRQLEEEVTRLKQEWKPLEEKTKGDKELIVALFQESAATVVEKHKEWTDERGENVDLEELERKKVDIQSQINMTTRVNQSVIQTYEQRRQKIEDLRRSIERKERDYQRLEAKITNVKDKWYPQLKALVNRVNARFSAAFDRIKCAGEVHLAEHEDFDKWSIEILVKFRSNEPLQLLTGQRQSGGERSLTTILYLMSLTGLAKTPFALVDEINQGMDVKYERAVHNELIQVTCAEDSGQYFLITPKLLPNLTYHENVTVLVINNGDWLPETRDAKGNVNNYGDLGAYLSAYRKSIGR